MITEKYDRQEETLAALIEQRRAAIDDHHAGRALLGDEVSFRSFWRCRFWGSAGRSVAFCAADASVRGTVRKIIVPSPPPRPPSPHSLTVSSSPPPPPAPLPHPSIPVRVWNIT